MLWGSVPGTVEARLMGLDEVALTCVPGPREMLAESLKLRNTDTDFVCGGGHRDFGLIGWKSLIKDQEMYNIMTGCEQSSLIREPHQWAK